jgi:uncharacterized membrane protein YgdD (TMEM256/DUF423 family)
MKFALLAASVYGFLSVLLGALGAHALKTRLLPEQLLSWDSAVRYQMFHALALLAAALLIDKGLPLKPAVFCFSLGTALFSGSIYLLCLHIGPRALLGPITPLGGLTLLLGWIFLFRAALQT